MTDAPPQSSTPAMEEPQFYYGQTEIDAELLDPTDEVTLMRSVGDLLNAPRMLVRRPTLADPITSHPVALDAKGEPYLPGVVMMHAFEVKPLTNTLHVELVCATPIPQGHRLVSWRFGEEVPRVFLDLGLMIESQTPVLA